MAEPFRLFFSKRKCGWIVQLADGNHEVESIDCRVPIRSVLSPAQWPKGYFEGEGIVSITDGVAIITSL